MSPLNWERELLSFQDPDWSQSKRTISPGQCGLLVVIDVEKVRVKQGLNNACNNRDRLEGSLEGSFSEIPVDPVRNVKRSVHSQGEQVVCSNRVCFSGALQHEQLRQDRNGFQPNRERPKNLDAMSSILSGPIGVSR